MTAGPSGPEELEQVAILDLDTNTVIAIEPHRQGKKTAEWTWQDDRVVVASVDGANDEFVLRTARPQVARRETSGGAWSPFGVTARRGGAAAAGRSSSFCSATSLLVVAGGLRRRQRTRRAADQNDPAH